MQVCLAEESFFQNHLQTPNFWKLFWFRYAKNKKTTKQKSIDFCRLSEQRQIIFMKLQWKPTWLRNVLAQFGLLWPCLYLMNLHSERMVSALDWISVYPVGCLSFFHLQPDVQNKDVIQLPFSSGSGLNSLVLRKKIANKAGTFCCIFQQWFSCHGDVFVLTEVNLPAFRGENGLCFASIFSA